MLFVKRMMPNWYFSWSGRQGPTIILLTESLNHTEVAKTYNAILAPVGEQWKTHFDETGDFSYYGPDQFHPSLEGSTAAAKIILASLQKSL